MLGFFLSLPLSVSAEHFLWFVCVRVSFTNASSSECSFSAHFCFSIFLCPSEGDDLRPADIPKPSLPSVLPKKPPPLKTSSSPFSLPPRRPDRPPSLASVHPHQHKLASCGNAHVFLLKSEAWRCCMVYLPRCDSPKSEAGSFTSDSALDRSHDGGEFLMRWNEDVWLHWLAAHSLHASLSQSSEALPAKVWIFIIFLNCGCRLQTSTWMPSSCRQKSWVIRRCHGRESTTVGRARRSSHQWVWIGQQAVTGQGSIFSWRVSSVLSSAVPTGQLGPGLVC